jgi:hypothetical protein
VLTHRAQAEAGLLVLLRVLLAEAAAPLLLTLLALLALLALLHQRQDCGRQRLLHGLLHSAAHALLQGVMQRDGQVRVGVVGDALLLQLLLDLLNLLQRLLHALRDLLARLLAGLLDGLLDHLRELLLGPGDLLAELLQGRGTGHHRHECSVRCSESQQKR